MKENKELERDDLCIGREMEVDCGIGQEITAYIETWFDVDAKFGTDTRTHEDERINLYGKYNPFADTFLSLEKLIVNPLKMKLLQIKEIFIIHL